MDELKQFLEQMDWMAEQMDRPDSFEGYVLREGRSYESQELTPDEMAYVLAISKRMQFPIKQCYYNSQMLLTMRDHENRLTYVEGFCAHAVIPVLHGWLEIGGKVVDVTMRTKNLAKRRQLKDRVLGSWSDGRQYWGVRFDREYVVGRMIDRRAAGSLIDDWEGRFPLLRRERPEKPGQVSQFLAQCACAVVELRDGGWARKDGEGAAAQHVPDQGRSKIPA